MGQLACLHAAFTSTRLSAVCVSRGWVWPAVTDKRRGGLGHVWSGLPTTGEWVDVEAELSGACNLSYHDRMPSLYSSVTGGAGE